MNSPQLNRLASRPMSPECPHRIHPYIVEPNTVMFCTRCESLSNTMNPNDVCRSSTVRPLFEFPVCAPWMSAMPTNRVWNGLRNWRKLETLNCKSLPQISINKFEVMFGARTHFVMHTMSDTARLLKHIAAKHLSAGIWRIVYRVVIRRASSGMTPV